MKLKWQQAPVKTQWGDEMVVASVAIDNDHTLSLYCERDQTPKVDAMLAQQEPEAWMTQARCFVDVSEFTEAEAKLYGWKPLYTSPQPALRTWVGLTDEEVIAMSRYDLEYAALIGEVQRRLKEKNT